MWISEKIIEKYESGSDWKYDLAVLLGEDVPERRTRQHTFFLDDDLYLDCGRQELVKELEAFERKGLIKVKWYQLGSYATEFKYQLADIPNFYEILDRMPKPQKVQKQLKDVDKYLKQASKSWIIQILEKERSQILEGKQTEDERKVLEFYDCLLGLDRLTSPTFKRVFSKQYLNNSKRFEQKYQGRILAAARKYHDHIDEEMNDTQVLSELYIEEYAQELAVKGPLHLMLEGRELHLEDFCYGTVLNSQTLERAQIPEHQPIRKVISVENKANFVSMPYEEGTLYLFSHGFFSPKEREFLVRLRKVLEYQTEEGAGVPVEYYHTGDLDYGGLRIFRYIKEKIFPELKPLQMDVETYHRYETYGETMTESIRRKLEALEASWQESEDGDAVKNLIAEMLKEGYILEQEAFLINKE